MHSENRMSAMDLMKNAPLHKVTYKVGDMWNRDGRLKELRIRHLARKFLHLWIRQTFGQITPSQARSYHNKLIMRKVFRTWKDEWWHARREWTMNIRAVCHYKYVLFSKVYQAWCEYLSIQKEKKETLQIALLFAKRRQMRVVWKGWELYVEMRRLRHRMHDTALKHHRHMSVGWIWSVWKSALMQRRIEHHHEDFAVKQWGMSVQSRAWQQWKKKYAQTCILREKEARANLHYCQQLLKRVLECWITHTQYRKVKNEAKAVTGSICCHLVLRRYWYAWHNALQNRQTDKDNGQLAENLTLQATKRHAFSHWRDDVHIYAMKVKKKQTVIQNQHCHLLVMGKFWKRWQLRLEQIEERSIHRQITVAVNYHSQRQDEHAVVYDSQQCMRRALIGWHKYVEFRIKRNRRLMQIDKYYQYRLLKRMFGAWKQRHEQTRQITQQKCFQEHQDHLLRRMLCLSGSNARMSVEETEKEIRAKFHYQRNLLSKMLLAWRQRAKFKAFHRQQQEELLTEAQHDLDRVRMWTVVKRWREKHSELREERLSMEKACRYHHHILLKKSLRAWFLYNYQHKHYQAMKNRSSEHHRLRVCQDVFVIWKAKLQSRRREEELTEIALWHWSLNLQAKVLCGWRHWVAERRRKRSRLVAAPQCYKDELLQEGVTHVLTYATPLSAFEQSSQHLQTVVRRCALRWKQRALCKSSSEGETTKRDGLHKTKKSVSFALPEVHSHTHQPIWSSATGQRAGDSTVNKLLLARASRLQPRKPDDLLYSPVREPLQHLKPSGHSHTDHYKETHIRSAQQQHVCHADTGSTSLLACAPMTSPSHLAAFPFSQPQLPGLFLSTSPQPPVPNINPSDLVFRSDSPGNSTSIQISAENHSVLLPPSSFTQSKSLHKTSSRHKDPSLLSPQDFTHPNQRGQSVYESVSVDGEDEEMLMEIISDSTESLNKELYDIAFDLQRYQQDKIQLQTWRKLQKVMRNWLQTTGSSADAEERDSIIQELNELQIRISSLSEKMAEQKPTMICHAARINSIESQLQKSSFKI